MGVSWGVGGHGDVRCSCGRQRQMCRRDGSIQAVEFSHATRLAIVQERADP